MQQVFLSYTFNPHPDHEAETAALRRRVGMVIESMDLREVTGEDLAGGGLTPEIRARIEAADSLVALLTPHNVAGGVKMAPPWVSDEFAHAKARGKPAIRIVHAELTAGGMYASDEHIPYAPAGTADTLIKLMRTLALWKRQQGRPTQVEIAAGGVELPFDPGQGHRCDYQLFADFKEGDWLPATIWREPGAMYAFLKGVPDQSKLRLRMMLNGAIWQSDFQNPIGRVHLSKRTP